MSAFLILITDTKTGEERQVAAKAAWDEATEFGWAEGNYSCDCNREIFFRAVKGEDNSERACGFDRFCLRVTDAQGQEVYSDRKVSL